MIYAMTVCKHLYTLRMMYHCKCNTVDELFFICGICDTELKLFSGRRVHRQIHIIRSLEGRVNSTAVQPAIECVVSILRNVYLRAVTRIKERHQPNYYSTSNHQPNYGGDA